MAEGTRFSFGRRCRNHTRSQFRQPVLPFKSVSPSQIIGTMDATSSHPSSPSHLHPGYGSPIRSGRTIREYDKDIDDLRKENFNLKLRIYFLEKKMNEVSGLESSEIVRVNVQLHIELETLQKEAKCKDRMLEEALKATKQIEVKYMKSKEKMRCLEQQITSLTQELQANNEHFSTPLQSDADSDMYKEAFGIARSLSNKSSSSQGSDNSQEKLVMEVQVLQKEIASKDKEICEAREKIQQLQDANHSLGVTGKKKSLAIQGLVQKVKELPDCESREMWFLLRNGIEAAKNKDAVGIVTCVNEIKSSFSNLISMPASELYQEIPSEAHELQKTFQVQDKTIKDLKRQLSDQQNWLRSSEDSVNERLKQAKKHAKEMEMTLEERETIIQKNASQLEVLRKECASRQKSVGELQHTLDVRTSALESLCKVREKLLVDVEQREMEVHNLQISHCELEQELNALRCELKRISHEKSNFPEKISIDSGQVHPVKRVSVGAQTSVVDTVSNAIQTEPSKTPEVFSLQQKLDEGDNEVASLKNEVFVLEKQVHEAKFQKSIVSRQLELLQQHLEKLAVFMEQLIQDKYQLNCPDDGSVTPEILEQASKCLDETLQLSNNISQSFSIQECSQYTLLESSAFAVASESEISRCAKTIFSSSQRSLKEDNTLQDWGNMSKGFSPKKERKSKVMVGNIEKRLSTIVTQQTRLSSLMENLEGFGAHLTLIAANEPSLSMVSCSLLGEINNLKTMLADAVHELHSVKVAIKENVTTRNDKFAVEEFRENFKNILHVLKNNGHSASEVRDTAEKALLELEAFKKQLITVSSAILERDGNLTLPSEALFDRLEAGETVSSLDSLTNIVAKESTQNERLQQKRCSENAVIRQVLPVTLSKHHHAADGSESVEEVIRQAEMESSVFHESQAIKQPVLTTASQNSLEFHDQVKNSGGIEEENGQCTMNFDSAESLCKDLKESLTVLEQKLKVAELKCCQYEFKFNEMLKEEGEALFEHKDLKSAIKFQDFQVEEVMKECSSIKEHASLKVENLVFNLAALKHKHVDLENQNAQFGKDLDSSEALCRQLNNELTETRKKLEELEVKCNKYGAKFNKLLGEKNKILSEKESLESAVKIQDSTIEELTTEFSAAKRLSNEAIVDTESQVFKLNEELRKRQASYAFIHAVKSVMIDNLLKKLRTKDVFVKELESVVAHHVQKFDVLRGNMNLEECKTSATENKQPCDQHILSVQKYKTISNFSDGKFLSLEELILALQTLLQDSEDMFIAKQQHIETLTADVLMIKQSVKDQNSAFQKTEEERQKIAGQLQENLKELKMLKKQKAKLEYGLADVEQKLIERNALFERNKKEKEKIANELIELQQSHEDWEIIKAEKTGLEKEILNLNQQLNENHAILQCNTAEKARIIQELMQKQEEQEIIKHCKTEMENKVLELEQEISVRDLEIDDLKKENERNCLNERERCLNRERVATEKLTNELQHAHQEISILQEQTSHAQQLQVASEKLKNELQHAHQEISILQEQLSHAQQLQVGHSQQISDLSSEKSNLLCQLKETGAVVDMLKVELESSADQVKDLESRLKEKCGDIESLQLKLKETGAVVDRLKVELESSADQVKDLESRLKEKCGDIESLQLKLREETTLYDRLKAEVKEKNDRIYCLVQDREQQANLVQQLEENLREKSDTFSTVKHALEEVVAQLKVDVMNKSEYVNQLELKIRERDDVIKQLKAEEEQKKIDVSELQPVLESKSNYICQLELDLKESKHFAEKLEPKLKEALSEVQKLKSECNSQRVLNNRLETSVNEKSWFIDRLLDEIEKTKSLVSESHCHMIEKNSLVDQLNTELKKQNDVVDQLKAEVGEKSGLAIQLKHDLEGKNELVEQLKAEVIEKNKVVNELQVDAANKCKFIEQLRLDCEGKNKLLRQLEGDIDRLQSESVKLQLDLKERSSFLTHLQSELKEMIASNEEREVHLKDLKQKTAEIDRLKIDVACKSAGFLEMASDLKKKNTVIVQLETIVNEKNALIKELESSHTQVSEHNRHLEGDVKKQLEMVVELNEALREKSSYIDELQRELEEKSVSLQSLKDKVSKAKVTDLTEQIQVEKEETLEGILELMPHDGSGNDYSGAPLNDEGHFIKHQRKLILGSESCLEETNSIVDDLNINLREANSHMEHELKKKLEAIAMLEAALQEKSCYVTQLRNELEKKSAFINHLESELKKSLVNIRQLKQETESKDITISELQSKCQLRPCWELEDDVKMLESCHDKIKKHSAAVLDKAMQTELTIHTSSCQTSSSETLKMSSPERDVQSNKQLIKELKKALKEYSSRIHSLERQLEKAFQIAQQETENDSIGPFEPNARKSLVLCNTARKSFLELQRKLEQVTTDFHCVCNKLVDCKHLLVEKEQTIVAVEKKNSELLHCINALHSGELLGKIPFQERSASDAFSENNPLFQIDSSQPPLAYKLQAVLPAERDSLFVSRHAGVNTADQEGSISECKLNSTTKCIESELTSFDSKEKAALLKKLRDTEDELRESNRQNVQLENKVRELFVSMNSKHETSDASSANISDTFNKSEQGTSSSNTEILDKLINCKWDLQKRVLDLQAEIFTENPMNLEKHLHFVNHLANIHHQAVHYLLASPQSDPVLHSPASVEEPTHAMKYNLLILKVDLEFLENVDSLLRYYVIPLAKNVGLCGGGSGIRRQSEFQLHCENRDASSKATSNGKDSSLFRDTEIEKRSIIQNDDILAQNTLRNRTLGQEGDAKSEVFLTEGEKCPQVADFMKSPHGEGKVVHSSRSSQKLPGTKEAEKTFMLSEACEMQCKMAKLAQENSVLKEKLSLMRVTLSRNHEDGSHFVTDGSDQESAVSADNGTNNSKMGSQLSLASSCEHKYSRETQFGKSYQVMGVYSVDRRFSGDTEPKPAFPPDAPMPSHFSDFIAQRSDYSSPDLGIESDPNQDGAVAESVGSESSFPFPLKEGSKQFEESLTLHALGTLEEFELLKKEIQECLIGMKSIGSRVDDGLKNFGKNGTPRKLLEYSTLKGIKDGCNDVEICLLQAQYLTNNFIIVSLPFERESGDWAVLLKENQDLKQELSELREEARKQETKFHETLEQLNQTQKKKDIMQRNIAKQLVETKKVLRRTKANMLGEPGNSGCPHS